MKNINTRILVTLSLLISLEVILTRFLSIQTPIVRIGFTFVPIAVSAIMFGPVFSGISAAFADVIGMMLFPAGAYFPGFTLTAFLTGAIYGLFLYNKNINILRISAAVIVVSIFVNLGLDTVSLWILTGKGFEVLLTARIIKCISMIPIQIITIKALWSLVVKRLIFAVLEANNITSSGNIIIPLMHTRLCSPCVQTIFNAAQFMEVNMIFIKNKVMNPCINHAIEEYLINNFDDDCFMLWRNEPCILIGKNQNTLTEINVDYVNEHNIPVVRRMSGGGTIFCDLGNILFTFISKEQEKQFADFSKFTDPIIYALEKLSIKAELSGRNDLLINGKKFSGNAQYNSRNKTLHHGSILFSSSISDLTKALRVKNIKFEDKAVKSIESRVTNISEHLKEPMNVLEFIKFLNDCIIRKYCESGFYEFTEEDWNEIRKISKEKYETWDWNYGHSPKFNYVNEKKFAGGIVQCNMNVAKGIINEIKFYGDFFSKREVMELEEVFIGCRYLPEDVNYAMNNINIDDYMSKISKTNLIQLMFDWGENDAKEAGMVKN